jgi:hypothetical protein
MMSECTLRQRSFARSGDVQEERLGRVVLRELVAEEVLDVVEGVRLAAAVGREDAELRHLPLAREVVLDALA